MMLAPSLRIAIYINCIIVLHSLSYSNVVSTEDLKVLVGV